MDIRLFEDFLNLAQTGSFTRTAEQRHITQPALSRRIRSLESWAGAPLIDRSTHPTTLTPAGQIFSDTIVEALRLINIARKDISAAQRSGKEAITISVLHTLALTFVPPWLKYIEDRGLSAHCRFLSDNMHGCLEALVERSADFLLCFTHASAPILPDDERFQSMQLGMDSVLPVCGAREDGSPVLSLPGTTEQPCRFLAYTAESYLGRVLESSLNSRSQRPVLKRVYENSFSEALKTMAMAGHGVAWLPLQSIHDDMATGRLIRAGGPEWDLSVDVRLFRSSAELCRAAEELWECCREYASGGWR